MFFPAQAWVDTMGTDGKHRPGPNSEERDGEVLTDTSHKLFAVQRVVRRLEQPPSPDDEALEATHLGRRGNRGYAARGQRLRRLLVAHGDGVTSPCQWGPTRLLAIPLSITLECYQC